MRAEKVTYSFVLGMLSTSLLELNILLFGHLWAR